MREAEGSRMDEMTRRMAVSTISLTGMGVAVGAGSGGGRERRLGLVIHSLWHRWRGEYSSVKIPPLRTVLEVLDHCREEGYGGLQTTVGDWTLAEVKQIRETLEGADLYLEGSVELPNDEGDVDRFEKEVRRAKEAGVKVFRSYLGGRRYEDLKSMADVKRYREVASRRLGWAEAGLRRIGVCLGVENHKDLRSEELVEVLRAVGSAHIGCCLDFGNSLALLEAPEETMRELGPYLVTTHVKDMAVRPSGDGFEMAEVPLGKGMLDLPGLMAGCVVANPEVTFNLEMITRDPLKIPCLEAGYWKVMEGVSGEALAGTLRLVRDRKAVELERVGGRSKEAICVWEAEQNAASAAHAFAKLGLVRNGTGGG
jgi:sugar phosphate isomerase/epimerase